jgi:hypothetical protein
MQQHGAADDGHDAGNAAHDDGHELLDAVADPECIEKLDRREQADQVAEEDDEDADVEQDRAPDQLPPAQELARARFPREGIALVARDRAEDEDRQRDVGKNLEEEEFHGDVLSGSVARYRRGRRHAGENVASRRASGVRVGAEGDHGFVPHRIERFEVVGIIVWRR